MMWHSGTRVEISGLVFDLVAGKAPSELGLIRAREGIARRVERARASMSRAWLEGALLALGLIGTMVVMVLLGGGQARLPDLPFPVLGVLLATPPMLGGVWAMLRRARARDVCFHGEIDLRRLAPVGGEVLMLLNRSAAVSPMVAGYLLACAEQKKRALTQIEASLCWQQIDAGTRHHCAREIREVV